MTYKQALGNLIRLRFPEEEARNILSWVHHRGTYHTRQPAGEPGVEPLRVIVDCNRAGMENAYTISLS